MRTLYPRLRSLFAFIALVRDPTRTERIFAISETMRAARPDLARRVLEPFLEQPEFRRLLAEERNSPISIERLESAPKSSLGRELFEFLDSRGFDPNAFPMLRNDDPVEFFISRIRRSHDLWHVLTGYDTEVGDELALQAFTYAQVEAPISVMVLAGGLIHLLLKDPGALPPVFESIVEGYQRGRQAKPLLYFRYEEEWGTGLGLLQERLNIRKRAL